MRAYRPFEYHNVRRIDKKYPLFYFTFLFLPFFKICLIVETMQDFLNNLVHQTYEYLNKASPILLLRKQKHKNKSKASPISYWTYLV